MKPTLIQLLLWIVAGSLALGQVPKKGDPFQEFLFPPELVMRHQSALDLSSEQANYVLEQIQEAQRQFTGFQWRLQGEVETLARLLSGDTVDEQTALAQLNQVLDLERQIKKTHLTLAVRIKNRLTPEQREILRRIRQKAPEPPR